MVNNLTAREPMPAIATTAISIPQPPPRKSCAVSLSGPRQGQSPFWLVVGIPSVIVFAWLLTLAPVEHAGSAYAAYGDVNSVASLLWLWLA